MERGLNYHPPPMELTVLGVHSWATVLTLNLLNKSVKLKCQVNLIKLFIKLINKCIKNFSMVDATDDVQYKLRNKIRGQGERIFRDSIK